MVGDQFEELHDLFIILRKVEPYARYKLLMFSCFTFSGEDHSVISFNENNGKYFHLPSESIFGGSLELPALMVFDEFHVFTNALQRIAQIIGLHKNDIEFNFLEDFSKENALRSDQWSINDFTGVFCSAFNELLELIDAIGEECLKIERGDKKNVVSIFVYAEEIGSALALIHKLVTHNYSHIWVLSELYTDITNKQ